MYRSRQSLTAAALAILGLVASSCSCGGDVSTQLAPKFVLEGEAVGADPRGEVHYAINFGMITVGSRFSPEVYVRNDGNASLSVQVEDASSIAKPFSLASGTFELAPKTSRPLEFTIAPSEEGSFDTVVTVTTNERDNTKKIRLMGTATRSKFVCDPLHLDIGHVVVGESRSATVTCTNNLEIPTTISLAPFVGAPRNFFSAEMRGVGDGQGAEIPAGGSVEIEIEFNADNITGPVAVTLPLKDPSDNVVESIHVTATAVDWALQVLVENEEGERVPLSGCFTFPDTDIEMEEIGSVWVRNVSRNPVQITGAALEKETVDFTYLGPFFDEPVTVAPDGEEEIELTISFTPSTATQHSNNLVIQGAGNRAAPHTGLKTCIQGQGGGARISCMPSSIDFGQVALKTAVTRSYKCTNSAIVRDGVPLQVLYVTDVESSDPERFTAEIRDLNKQGYYPGEEFWVDVTYRPDPEGEEGLDSAIIYIHNDSTANPKHETPVSGFARDLPPCVFNISPQNIRFGVVAPGSQQTLTAHVVNQAEHECILSAVQLTDDSDPEFSMDLIESVIIPGRPTDPEDESTDYRFPLTVTFSPTDVGTFSGAITFFISDPDNEIQEIPLSGIGEVPCLDIDPDPAKGVDFGAAPPGCSGRLVTISVQNSCSQDLRLDAVTIMDADDNLDAPQFVLYKLPRLPQELKANDKWEFDVYFRPDGVGLMEGWINIDVSQNKDGEVVDAGPYTVRLFGEGKHDAMQTDSYSQSDRPKVDVLWVIDNSGSMSPFQLHLQSKIPQFMSFAIEQNVDFHIGVTTTGLAGTNYNCPGGFNGAEDGRLFPHPDLGRPRILKSTMRRDELMEAFAENVMVGTCHGLEYVFEAAKRALSDPWINTPLEDGGNQGFLRRDASLSIIGMTDEPEQSSGTVASYVKFFQDLKPSRMKEDVKIHMISGGYTGCSSPYVSACPRCVQATEESGGLYLDLCTPLTDDETWDAAFLEMSEGAFGFDTAFGLRGEPADQNGDGVIDQHDVEVRVGGRIRDALGPTGARIWRYNPENNSIAFAPLHVPGANQVIEVTYKVACIQHD